MEGLVEGETEAEGEALGDTEGLAEGEPDETLIGPIAVPVLLTINSSKKRAPDVVAAGAATSPILTLATSLNLVSLLIPVTADAAVPSIHV